MGAEKLDKKRSGALVGGIFLILAVPVCWNPSTGAGILFSCMDLRDSVFRSKFLFLE